MARRGVGSNQYKARAGDWRIVHANDLMPQALGEGQAMRMAPIPVDPTSDQPDVDIGPTLDGVTQAITNQISHLLLELHPDARFVELHWEDTEPTGPGDLAYTATISTIRDDRGDVVVWPESSDLTVSQKDTLAKLEMAYCYREQVSAVARYFNAVP